MKPRTIVTHPRTVVSLLQALCLLLLLASNLRAADPLDSWNWKNPLPNGSSMNGVAYGAGLIVGVGSAGVVMTSTNLTNAWWVRQSIGTDVSTLNAIAYGNGTFVVAAGDNLPSGDKTLRFLTSTDGTNWVARVWPNGNTRAVYGLAYGAGLFVAVCERAEIWTSPDGATWTQRVSPQTGSNYKLAGVTYRPDVGFAAIGDTAPTTPEIVTSQDGITWALQNTGTLAAYSLNAITWGYVTNGDLTVSTNFVAVGGRSGSTAPLLGTIATSIDGTNWATQFSAEFGTNCPGRLYGAAFRPGVGYIAVGRYGDIQTSTDGTNWTSSWSDGRVAGNDFAGATYATDLGYFVAVGSSGAVETAPVGRCASCIYPASDWTAEFGGRPENLTGIARGNVNFAAVGIALAYAPNYAIILTSPNGSTWTVRSSGTTSKLNNVAYGAGTFVAVGVSGAIVTSVNEGTNWTAQTVGTASLNGVSYITNSVTNLFLATGASGAILTSPDGINWTVQSSGTANALYCAAYGANTYVVAGVSGTMLSSPDFTTWTPVTSGIVRDINGLAFANNVFVAACAYGYILTSPNGSTWTRQVSPFGSDNSSSRTYSTVAYGNGVFVIAGSTSSFASAIQSSPDGINWSIRPSAPSSSSFKTITYAPNTFLGVGNGGMIMQAGTLAPPQIYYTNASGTLTLTWAGGGSLLASPNVTGPYTNVPGAASPWPITPLSEPSMFFRVLAP